MNVQRVILGVATLGTALACAGFGVWGFANGQPLLGVVGLVLTGGFGVFVRNDYRYFFGKK